MSYMKQIFVTMLIVVSFKKKTVDLLVTHMSYTQLKCFSSKQIFTY